MSVLKGKNVYEPRFLIKSNKIWSNQLKLINIFFQILQSTN